jgi:acyl-CoA dehydrogenase
MVVSCRSKPAISPPVLLFSSLSTFLFETPIHSILFLSPAARSYELMLQRACQRKTFGQFLWQHGGCQEMIADSASDLQAARLLTLACAEALDTLGPKMARDKIASIKVTVPELCYRIVDRAIQVHGGAGLCEDYPLARFLAGLRSLRIADGPDAVHKRTVALIEIQKAMKKKRAQQQQTTTTSMQSRL